MRCQDLMKTDLECASPQDTVQDAARRMKDQNIGFLPVCDPSNRVLGTVTDRDLAIRVLADGGPASTLIEEVMTREVVCCRPEDELQTAEDLMAKNQKSRIMCIDKNGQLVGIISLSDLAQHESATISAETLRQVTTREARA
jgi:CBS domain-containing protein